MKGVIISSDNEKLYVDVSTEKKLVKLLFWMNMHPQFIIERIYSSKNLITYDLMDSGYFEVCGTALQKLDIDSITFKLIEGE